MSIAPEVLRAQAPLFAELSDEQLGWAASRGSVVRLAPGESLFTEGQSDAHFFVLLEGEIQVTKDVGGQTDVLADHGPGTFTGEVPLLTGTPYVATARALAPSVALEFDRQEFLDLLSDCPTVASKVLPTLAQRIQVTESLMQQRSKLAALGGMAAGLAHELNNPAAAGSRAAHHLREGLAALQAAALRIDGKGMGAHQRLLLDELQREAAERMGTWNQLDPIAQSDLEDEVSTWLDEHGVEDGWEAAANLASARMDAVRLDGLAKAFTTDGHQLDPAFADVIAWLDATLSAAALVGEIEQSTDRISQLVNAVKEYSYMDQAPQQRVNVHEGIDNTLTILRHKLKGGIVVTREYDERAPLITAYGSELNQVWTNLLDNAIDALDGRGAISIRTELEYDHVLVEVTDDGPGIPADVLPRIFEPFFTTKGVGKGTGQGLDISYRIVVSKHKGDLDVDSRPGQTRFKVRLPIEPPK